MYACSRTWVSKRGGNTSRCKSCYGCASGADWRLLAATTTPTQFNTRSPHPSIPYLSLFSRALCARTRSSDRDNCMCESIGVGVVCCLCCDSTIDDGSTLHVCIFMAFSFIGPFVYVFFCCGCCVFCCCVVSIPRNPQHH